MKRSTLEKRFVKSKKLCKIANSVGVILPDLWLRTLNWERNSNKVVMGLDLLNKQIIIKRGEDIAEETGSSFVELD